MTKEVENPNPQIYNMRKCRSWGNAINWLNFDTRCVSGHQYRIPKVGDFLIAEMTSGKLYKFKFIKVEQCRDPKDMFFANVKDVGYCDEEGNLE